MGAAIPHLATLAVSLPDVLPFASDEVHLSVLTGSAQVQDEVIPDDEDEDISYQTREKSILNIVFTVGDGDDNVPPNVAKNTTGKTGSKRVKRTGGNKQREKGEERVHEPEQIVFPEPEQEEMDLS